MTVIQQHIQIAVDDTLAEAGRKIFAEQLEKMLFHEAGSRTGEDIESVHQMRVATRRMRSLFKLIGSAYTIKTVKKYNRSLRDIARALGAIRDLDVLLVDLADFRDTLSDDDKPILDSLISKLDNRRVKHRVTLNAVFDSASYDKFGRQFGAFTEKAGKGVAAIASDTTPHQIRHVLPVLLHERLSRVRAYETVLHDADDETLHALRVEFKQLRYALEFFKPVLGASVLQFIKNVKRMQDVLGRFHDVSVFAQYMDSIKRLSPEQQAVVAQYVNLRIQEGDTLRVQFREQWQSFNTRTVQRQFSDALLVLR
jgi:CHAD domain-containing protein